jgi:hypothetical protein
MDTFKTTTYLYENVKQVLRKTYTIINTRTWLEIILLTMLRCTLLVNFSDIFVYGKTSPILTDFRRWTVWCSVKVESLSFWH